MPISLELSKTGQKVFNKLKPESLDILEQKRLKYLNQYNIRRKLNWRFNLPVLALVIGLDTYFKGPHIGLVAYSVVPLLFVSFFKIPMKNYKRKYKTYFNKIFVTQFFAELLGYNYLNEKDVLEQKLDDFRLLGDYHTYFGEDYIKGSIGSDIAMEFEEIGVVGESNRFKGAAVLLTMPNSFKGRLIVKSKAAYLTDKNLTADLQELNIEDKNFAKYFNIYTNNITQAEDIIDVRVMKKVMETSKKLHDLFTEEFLEISPQYAHNINGYKNNTERKMSSASLELEFKDNQILLLLRGQYDLLAPARLASSAYCDKRLSVIEQEFKAIESIARLLKVSNK